MKNQHKTKRRKCPVEFARYVDLPKPFLLFTGLSLIVIALLGLYVSFQTGKNLITSIFVLFIGIFNIFIVLKKEQICKWLNEKFKI